MTVQWTEEEVALVTEAASSHTVQELAIMAGRTETAIRQLCYKRGITAKPAKRGPRTGGSVTVNTVVPVLTPNLQGREWTDEDDQELRDLVSTHTPAELAIKLNRSANAIRSRCRLLEIKAMDGRQTEEFGARISARRAVPVVREAVIEEPGQLQVCVGKLCNGAQKLVTQFAWNRSGLSRRNKCVDCVRAEGADSQAKHRAKNRPDDWAPSRIMKVECGPEGHRCTDCNQLKDHSEFGLDKSTECGFSSICKEGCNRKRKEAYDVGGGREWNIVDRSNWPPERREKWLFDQFVGSLRRNFGITLEQYEWLLVQQNGVCALCAQPEERVHSQTGNVLRLSVDHDHNHCSGKKGCPECVRGLLCSVCNLALGKVEKRPMVAARFADYLVLRPLLSWED